MSNLVKNHPDSKTTSMGIENAETTYVETLDKHAAEDDIPVSAFKDMPRRQAIWAFRKAILFAILVAWAAIMDGYLISSRSFDGA
jgi:ABC-type transporter Mla maintaining outer membrane lipid asymmetry permease subunit MlaE